jgi:hypothetical protein
MLLLFLLAVGAGSILFTTLFFYAACVVAANEPCERKPPTPIPTFSVDPKPVDMAVLAHGIIKEQAHRGPRSLTTSYERA